MKPGRHARVHLPPLEPAEALVAVTVLERAIAAIWRAHGRRMAELLHRHTDAQPEPAPDDTDKNTRRTKTAAT